MMTYATASTVEYGQSCSNCGDHLESLAKFCGGCGFIVAPNSFNINEYPEHAARIGEGEERIKVPDSMPTFARVKQETQNAGEINSEVSKTMVLLARERIFLYAHLLTFLAINLFGCWIALKCYYDFIGDEMSKIMIASTPFLFINSLALLVIIPIKGTRSEIARLKERLSHAKFKLDYGHLNFKA